MALQKNRMAIPFVEEAKALKVLASKAKTPKDLANIDDIQNSLLTAAGLSDKALNHLTEDDKKEAIRDFIKDFLEPAKKKFVDELVYRFLLTRGDTLGGKMRNIAGTLGEWKFTRALISTLSVKSKNFHYLDSDSRKWKPGKARDLYIEQKTKGLAWKTGGNHRTLRYNLSVPVIRKNVDLCLLKCAPEELSDKSTVRDPENYLALGELKGGIDPAGADEHWKTANSALERIRTGFSGLATPPLTFFVGAAIEKEMAKEIFNQLQEGKLTNAANLTDENQLVSLCGWLISI